MPVWNYDRKKEITFQTDNLLREKVALHGHSYKLNARHITHK